MIKHFILSSLFWFISACPADCQAGFSQFYASPLSFNPAQAGRFNKNYRAGGIFRRETNRQEQVFTQASFFSDIKLFRRSTREQDCFAAGFSGLSEKGASDGIRNIYLAFSLAYHKGLDDEGQQQLGIGFQLAYAHRQLTKPNYVFEDQLVSWFNSGYSNIDISQFRDTEVKYADLNAGLIYQGRINPANLFTAGVSLYHITKPKRVFPGGELNVSRQGWGHLGWESKINSNSKIYTAFLTGYADRLLNDLFAGLKCDISINRVNQFSLGAWFRSSRLLGSAIIPAAGFSFTEFTINTSYDISIRSGNKPLKNALEISLIYTAANDRKGFLEKRFIQF